MVSESTSKTATFVPAEIIIHILSYLRDQPAGQHTLYSCCLVSRQWYSAALPLLYERPYIWGSNFEKFALAVCPPAAAYAPRGDLGRFVRWLDFGGLVHHLSTSMTTRFLGRVRDNVEVFVAPASGFSTVNLSAVSKCKRLRTLDLIHVIKQIDFQDIKKAVRRLDDLHRLRLPRGTNINTPASHVSWPPNLRKLEITGRLDLALMGTFDWPPRISSLVLAGEALREPVMIPAILENPYLHEHLRRLRVPYESHHTLEHAEMLARHISNLYYLAVQEDLVRSSFFRALALLQSPLPLEILSFEESQEFPDFSKNDFIDALDGGLGNLRLVGIHESLLSPLRMVSDDELDELLKWNANRRGYSKKEIESGDIPVGVYYFG
ncbi:hypothetical protein PABG_04566 [Paracoccidioides brasiliensis Pb03]|nr:hypothetical protein PABG_04566 [Paracoccidioides brasiliensis Pb03]